MRWCAPSSGPRHTIFRCHLPFHFIHSTDTNTYLHFRFRFEYIFYLFSLDIVNIRQMGQSWSSVGQTHLSKAQLDGTHLNEAMSCRLLPVKLCPFEWNDRNKEQIEKKQQKERKKKKKRRRQTFAKEKEETQASKISKFIVHVYNVTLKSFNVSQRYCMDLVIVCFC